MFNTDIDSLIFIIYTIGLIEITSFDEYDNASFCVLRITIDIKLRELTIFKTIFE